ncbi:hypothetical protein LHT10_11455 [Lactococcus lactis]|uniref:hypothetical protein n=1 Tax=Lactococcus lactis TaxID=1358 RepID=UPI001F450E6F|nr:hypothetical protein [Lactococcus lactis]MCG1001748.1 hypothetical protein [Lactococcus lactis]
MTFNLGENSIEVTWFSFVNLSIIIGSIIYSIFLHSFKKSISDITNADYSSAFDRALAISNAQGYWSYLVLGILFLFLLLLFPLICFVKHRFLDIQWYELLIGILSNTFMISVVWKIFYDPIFTTVLVLGGIATLGSYLVYGSSA